MMQEHQDKVLCLLNKKSMLFLRFYVINSRRIGLVVRISFDCNNWQFATIVLKSCEKLLEDRTCYRFTFLRRLDPVVVDLTCLF